MTLTAAALDEMQKILDAERDWGCEGRRKLGIARGHIADVNEYALEETALPQACPQLAAIQAVLPALLAAAREWDRLREENVELRRRLSEMAGMDDAVVLKKEPFVPNVPLMRESLRQTYSSRDARLAKLEAVAEAARTLTDTANDAEIELPHAHRDSCITYADKHSSCDCGYETGESLRDGTDALRKALAALKETP